MTPTRLTLETAAVTLAAVLATAALVAPAAAQISENVDLLAHVDEYSGYNDIWGYTAPGGDEYAILGTETGTAFYNVTDPQNPSFVGFIDGPDSIWRDMKTFGNHCYIVTEGESPSSQTGLQIVDLSDPESPTLVNTLNQDFNSAHNIFIDTGAGRAYVVGTSVAAGTLIYDLNADPVNPTVVGQYSEHYVHDIYVKNDIAYVAAINDDLAVILDVSNPASPVELNSWAYPGPIATHNTWTNEDQTVLVTSDEASDGHLNFWDVSDPENHVFLDDYITGNGASAHNAFIRNGFCYVSYYTEGLRVLSIADPLNVEEVGYYDTYAGGGLYSGAWGAYPFAAQEGIVYVSDISNGLFVLEFNADFGTLSGTVVDAGTQQPIADATIEIVETGDVRHTSAAGTFSLPLDPGSYTVNVAAFGYEDASDGATVNIGETTVLDFELTALPSGSLAGLITDGTDAGIPDATVSLEDTPLSTVSQSDGSYAFPQVPADSYTVLVDRFRYAPRSEPVDIVADQQTTLDVTLSPAFYWTEMELPLAWTVSGNASTGQWVRVDPNGTGGGTVQPEDDHTIDPGVICWVTGQGSPGGGIGQNDVDNGSTILTTEVFDLSGLEDPVLQYHRWYVNDAGSNPGTDTWLVEISPDAGTTWITLEQTQETDASWRSVITRLRDLIPEPSPLDQIQLRFTASDLGGGSIVEAGVDDFQFYDAAAGPVAVSDQRPVPGPRFVVHGNFPNPFNPRTAIRFELPGAEAVRLRVYDAGGRMVRDLLDRRLEPGPHNVVWDGRNHSGRPMASGVYFYRLEAGDRVETRRMVLAK